VEALTGVAGNVSGRITLEDATGVGQARRLAAALAGPLGFDEEGQGRLALVVTELATNLLKHAGRGTILLRVVGGTTLEVVAVDGGPGIADIDSALRDGVSTAGTAGNGLGAVRRIASEFDVDSRRPGGTVVLARLAAGAAPRESRRLALGAVCVPHPAEEVAGDDWDALDTAEGCRVMVADGLGHGPLAREAAQSAMTVFRTSAARPVAHVIEACHEALRATRGAAVAIAEIDAAKGAVRFAGIGNVTGAVYDGSKAVHLVSMNGTAGLGTVRAREFTYAWPPRGILVMASDGINTRWTLGDYPGLGARDPSVIAAVLLREHTRGRDDATVVVVKGMAP
jgi:anti-sigma regulatory factor (Ser/Thr protein kinase)